MPMNNYHPIITEWEICILSIWKRVVYYGRAFWLSVFREFFYSVLFFTFVPTSHLLKQILIGMRGIHSALNQFIIQEHHWKLQRIARWLVGGKCSSSGCLSLLLFSLTLPLIFMNGAHCLHQKQSHLRHHRIRKTLPIELPIVASFTSSHSGANFTHVIEDSVTGQLYVGAVNYIFQFSSDLELEHEFQSGPLDDSPNCSPSGCSDEYQAQIRPTNNVNKALTIDPRSRSLIACGSARQGSCRRHKLDDVSKAEPLVEVPVVANDENSSSIIFFGSANFDGREITPVLYAAATYTRAGSYRELVPAISIRSLEDGPEIFTIMEKSFSDSGRLDISSELRDYYIVRYVHSFIHSGYVYFATVQRKSHHRTLEEWGYITRIARFCSSDAGFHSYVEVTLQCLGDSLNYNILQDAFILRVRGNLAEKMKIRPNSEVLFGVFVASRDHTTRLSTKSAVCSFPLSKIESKFAENIHLCFNGSVISRNMDYIAGSVNSCPESGRAPNMLNFCEESVKLNGSAPIIGQPLFSVDDSILTGIVVASIQSSTVAFLGTITGTLMKVFISGENEGILYDEIIVDFGKPILSDILLDYTHEYVLVASHKKIVKIHARKCMKRQKNCTKCSEHWNILCDLCSSDSRSLCTGSGHGERISSANSDSTENSSNVFTGQQLAGPHPKTNYQNPQLLDVHPKIGPKSGGTYLHIFGSGLNFSSDFKIYLDNILCDLTKMMRSDRQITCRTQPSPISPYWVQKLILSTGSTNLTLPRPFTYGKDPIITNITPLKSFFTGGRTIHVKGKNFLFIQQPKMLIIHQGTLTNKSLCSVSSDVLMKCPSPSVELLARTLFSEQPEPRFKLVLQISFEMDGVKSVQNLSYSTFESKIFYLPDPKFEFFGGDGVRIFNGGSFVIYGENFDLAATETEFNIAIGTSSCNLIHFSGTQIICTPPQVQPAPNNQDHDLPEVVVSIGRIQKFLGFLRYDTPPETGISPFILGTLSVIGALLTILSLSLLALFKYENSQAERACKRIQQRMNSLENNVRTEFKQAFAELQIDLIDLNSEIHTTEMPFMEHKEYLKKVFFPGLDYNPLSSSYKLLGGRNISNDHLINQFDELINDQNFLLTFITTLDSQKSFTIRDRVHVASLVMVVLLSRMDYIFRIIRHLLLRLIAEYSRSKHPQLLLRRTENVVEKMLGNWVAICMHEYLKQEPGGALFMLFSAIKHQIEKGPVDAITQDARYSLNEDKLLREHIEYSQIDLQITVENETNEFSLKVLDIDTVSQVKRKVLDTVYRRVPASRRPSIHSVDLQWINSNNEPILLSDYDGVTKPINGWKRLNTLSYYGMTNRESMKLIVHRSETYTNECERILYSSPTIPGPTIPHSQTIIPPSQSNIYYALTKRYPLINSQVKLEASPRYWHIVKDIDSTINNTQEPGNSHQKAIPEIYLTRLLSTKGTVQKYLDDFFASIHTVRDNLPRAVKWLFDLLDQCAEEYGIVDTEIVHTWKCNSLPLRFWINLVKNPDFIFDIEKTPAIDACLSVISQAFMDACSSGAYQLSKDSPTNKLLFAKDIPVYKEMIDNFHVDISNMPRVTDDEMDGLMRRLSLIYGSKVEKQNGLGELYVYALRYRESILKALYSDPENLQVYHQASLTILDKSSTIYE